MLKIEIKKINNIKHLVTSLAGYELINTPQLNKGTAFTKEERETFALEGLLPEKVETMEEQLVRVYAQYQSFATSLQKNIFLHELHHHNYNLFYRLVEKYVAEILPVIYTPTVGEAVKTYSHEYRDPYGALYISYPDRGNIGKILRNRATKEIDLIVVTDSERILGIGDQGVGGIHIPVAKLMLYSLFGGIDPTRTLPIVLDVGTNNPQHLADPFYLGWKNKRIMGKEYDDFIDLFMAAIQKEFLSPNDFSAMAQIDPSILGVRLGGEERATGVYLDINEDCEQRSQQRRKPKGEGYMFHWEDFGRDNAAKNLDRFRYKLCSFNDDIQGTAVITVAALSAALKIINQSWQEQRIVIVGAGSAGIGIANFIRLVIEQQGVASGNAYEYFWLVDRTGLIFERSSIAMENQKLYARKAKEIDAWQVKDPNMITLAETIRNIKPTILIGCSGIGGIFTEEVVSEMAKHVARPIVFALSNPTSSCEAKPDDVLHWTGGRALIATGTPFDPVEFNGEKIRIAQCNNVFAFPGVGLGVIASGAKFVSDKMLMQASSAIERATVELSGAKDALLPTIDKAADVALQVAISVAKQAYEEGLTDMDEATVVAKIKEMFWRPEYLPYEK